MGGDWRWRVRGFECCEADLFCATSMDVSWVRAPSRSGRGDVSRLPLVTITQSARSESPVLCAECKLMDSVRENRFLCGVRLEVFQGVVTLQKGG